MGPEGAPFLAAAYRTLLQKKGTIPPESRPLTDEVAKWALAVAAKK